ncbi:hypothetical protein [Burkholderia arboris]|uniref:hypothetical protein n=1 Tax=Burkholderia arboris TaxID=488730 RepID=UPI00158EEE88|nr:hypothetical protein [Burkholderia arboris]
MTPGVTRRTGIPPLDTSVAEARTLPRRELKIERGLPADFPASYSARKKQGDATDVMVVGAGWYYARHAVALAASGVTQIAFEMNPLKLGKGQIGSTGKDDRFTLFEAISESLLIADLTDEQLERLPVAVREVVRHEANRAVMEKRARYLAIRQEPGDFREKNARYDALPDHEKMSKREVIERNAIALRILQDHGVLKIVEKEVTVDMVASRLEARKPVFMASGQQVNLTKMGMDHLAGKPGFVKEFLLGSPETEAAIEQVVARQQALLRRAREAGVDDPSAIPDAELPAVAFVGGGPIAQGSALDMLKRVRPDLVRIVWISPVSKPLDITSDVVRRAREKFDFRSVGGSVTGLTRSEDGGSIASVTIADASSGEPLHVATDLFIHTHNEVILGNGDEAETVRGALASITQSLDEAGAGNALVRDRGIVPADEVNDLRMRITQPLKGSLNDDTALRAQIARLVTLQNGGHVPTIVANGSNPMTQGLALFAASHGFRGRFIQVAQPMPKEKRSQHAALDEKRAEVREWRDVAGRLVADGTAFGNGKFSLGVRNAGGKTERVPDVDILINAAGKTRSTPLVDAMKKKGYIERAPEGFGFSDLRSNHPLLGGQQGFFAPAGGGNESESPSLTIFPGYGMRSVEPSGWETTFEFGVAVQEAASPEREPAPAPADEPSSR